MAGSYKIPPDPSSAENYEIWCKDIKIWAKLTDLPKAKQGLALQFACKNDKRIHETVVNLSSETVECEQGLDNVIKALDGLFKKDKTELAYQAYENFENFRRQDDQKMFDFLHDFDRLLKTTENHGTTMSKDLIAYRLLKAANLSETQQHIIRATVTEFTYDQVKEAIKKIFGNKSSNDESLNIKTENINQACLNEYPCEEEINYGYAYNKYPNSRFNRGNSRFPARNSVVPNQDRRMYSKQRGKNPLDAQGNVTRCAICSSINHWANKCPDRGQSEKVNLSEDQEKINLAETHDIILFESDLDEPRNVKSLLFESLGCAVLDCGASKSVCGDIWYNDYINSLPESEKSNIKIFPSSRNFKFGYNDSIKSEKYVHIPIVVGNRKVLLGVDVIKAEIPLLLSMNSLLKAKAILNTPNNTLTLLDQTVPLIVTSSGHYIFPLNEKREIMNKTINNCHEIVLHVSEEKSKEWIAKKLHRQFAHCSKEKLIRLIELSKYENDEDLKNEIKKVSENCNVCKIYRKAPPKPIVSLPLATRFNELIAMDIKFIEDKMVLHLIDLCTRFSVGTVIKSKDAKTIIEAIFKYWIQLFGAPEKILSDNGKEFANELLREVCEAFNIQPLSTPAESPWSNGVVERHNATLGEMVLKLREDTKCSIEIAVAWAVSAKNALTNVHGFCPAQLVLGYIPNLPSVQTNKPPALSAESYSKIVEDNLKIMHAARREYLRSESSSKIRRAINNNIRTTGDIKFINGDRVYYKRNDSKRWHGPGYVIGQDGQHVLVRHQSTWIRVHPCRLLMVNKESQGQETKKAEHDQKTSKVNESRKIPQEDESLEYEPYENLEHENNEYEGEDEVDPENEHQGNDGQGEIGHQGNENLREYQEEGEHDEENQRGQENEGIGENENNQEGTHQEEVPNTRIKIKIGDQMEFMKKNEDTWIRGYVHSRAGKANGKYKNEFNMIIEDGTRETIDFDRHVKNARKVKDEHEDNDEDEMILSAEVIKKNDEDIMKAKEKELSSWIQRKVYNEIDNAGQSTINTKWVISIKQIEGVPGVKARLVAKGYQDLEDVRSDSPCVTRAGVRLVLVTIATNGWDMKSLDISTAFLQSRPISRNVYLKPPKEAKTKKIWHLNKAVYGLHDANREWFLKIKEVLTQNECIVSKFDQGLFRWFQEGVIAGVIALHVDDLLYGGCREFIVGVIQSIRNNLTVGSEDNEAFKYLGVELNQEGNKDIVISQNKYAETIKAIEITPRRESEKDSETTEEEKKSLRSKAGKLLWLAGMTRPDLSFRVCQISTKISTSVVQDILYVNIVIRDVKSHQSIIRIPKLNPGNIKILVFADASYKNLPDNKSQGGHIILLTDGEKVCPLVWKSIKIKRVVRSTISAETLAMADACDTAIYLRYLVAELFPGEIPIVCISDNKSLVESSLTTNKPEEERLQLELSALREMVEKKEISMIWTESKNQISDVMTKSGSSPKQILSIMRNAILQQDLGTLLKN